MLAALLTTAVGVLVGKVEIGLVPLQQSMEQLNKVVAN